MSHLFACGVSSAYQESTDVLIKAYICNYLKRERWKQKHFQEISNGKIDHCHLFAFEFERSSSYQHYLRKKGKRMPVC